VIWKPLLGVTVLLFFVCMGIAHVVWPDRFLERSGVRRGGEALNGANRLAFRIVGGIVAGGASYVLYELVRNVSAK
jgi:hypothetical protein